MQITKLFKEFFDSEKAGGLILLAATVLSLLISNSDWKTEYLSFWDNQLAGHSIVHWINDGLMAIFFLLIGLELEREIYKGELSDLKSASLPIIGAFGGMIVPAILFLVININTTFQGGAGIPMATDIAFAIGILSLLGNRVPASLKVLLTALAVIDDLGAIIVIAVFYSTSLSVSNLLIALSVFGVLLILNRLRVHNLIPYLIGGVVMWYFMLHSGVHATITGVLLAFAVPFGDGGEKSPSYILQHYLHKPVAFLLLPMFAIANTGLTLEGNWIEGLTELSSVGIIVGLVIGKPLGIWLFSFVGVQLGICSISEELKWKNILGIGFLGGIGFTMAIFITLLAYDDPGLINSSKIAILVASVMAGLMGYLSLRASLKPEEQRV